MVQKKRDCFRRVVKKSPIYRLYYKPYWNFGVCVKPLVRGGNTELFCPQQGVEHLPRKGKRRDIPLELGPDVVGTVKGLAIGGFHYPGALGRAGFIFQNRAVRVSELIL